MKIFSWGPNSKGQQGSGDCVDHSQPNRISLSFDLSDIKSIVCGATFSFIITTDGSVYVCGNNGKGQIGLGRVECVSVFAPLADLSRVRVAQVAAGWEFTVVLTQSGALYACGDNRHCQLGLEYSRVKSLSSFERIDVPPMKAVRVGMWHTLALSVLNEIWTWGYNHKGQLGPLPVRKSGFLPECRQIDNEEQIRFVIAGAYFSGFMTERHRIIMWGDNQYGQCGRALSQENDSDASNIVRPRAMESSLTDIIQLECGWNHCVARDASGVCYSWGQNTYCQLGRRPAVGDRDPVPRPINYFTDHDIKIKEINCGSLHNLAIDFSDSLWSWGWNDHGILGLGDFIDRDIPHRVRISDSETTVHMIGHGASHSFVLIQ